MARAHDYILISSSLLFSRAFLRDEFQAYYIGSFDAFNDRVKMDFTKHFKLYDIPLIICRVPLLRRWLSQPKLVSSMIVQTEWMLRLGVILPFDSFHMTMNQNILPDLARMYLTVPDIWNVQNLPALVKEPIPLVVYYYHTFLVDARSDYGAFWKRVMALEYVMMYCAACWHEARSHGRAVTVTRETIDLMKEELQRVENEAGIHGDDDSVRFSIVWRRMYEALEMNFQYRNVAHFHTAGLPNCFFVHFSRRDAAIDENATSGETWVQVANGSLEQFQ